MTTLTTSHPLIQDVTVLLPYLIADCAIYELEIIIGNLPNPEEYNRKLCAKAQYLFDFNKSFKQKLMGRNSRQTLLMFMKHWLLGMLKDNNIEIYNKYKKILTNG